MQFLIFSMLFRVLKKLFFNTIKIEIENQLQRICTKIGMNNPQHARNDDWTFIGHFFISKVRFWGVKKCIFGCSQYTIYDFNLDFYSKKNQLFFSTLKIILKIKNSKKGLCSHDFASIYYKHAKGHLPTMIGFQSGGGGISLRVEHLLRSDLYIYIYKTTYS